ncbi:MAG: TonB-dependent receptor, partial [Gammaproteobacteria bacterium]|nr:TonB-dependent receptor [Gammaproteobacteria bacterium]
AIAGVINVILKDDAEGFTVSAQTGEYFEGDGSRTTIAANGGFPLGDSGFLNATIERSTADKTSRGQQRADCQPVIDFVGPGVVPLDELCQRWGDPDVETLKFFLNAGVDIGDNAELFGNVSFSDNDTVSDFFYRHPVLDPSAMVAGRSTLIVDGNEDFIPDPADAQLVQDITDAGLNPSDYLTADAGSPSGFILLNPIYTLFPGGYNPDFGAEISDMAFVLGVRGETAGGMSWDVRGRVAEAEADYTLSQSINPSLGALSPTTFRPGKLTQEETSLNADFVRTFDVGNAASPLNFAFGFEFRNETYKIAAGDPASNSSGPAFIFGVGSDGFQGFPVESAGSFESDSIAGYVDVEVDVTDNFTLGAAVRYEDYDEFGDTTDGKLSGRLQVNDQFALRATVTTGFRAPTPGQVNTLNTTTSADTDGNLIPSGTYPVNSVIAQVLGSQPLTPEESTSFTLGAIWSPADNVSITLDYYDISIDDRLALFNTTITAQDVIDLTAAGVPNANLLLDGLANYFANAFDSEISGIDIAVTADFEVWSGDLTVDFRHNQNQQDVPKVASGTINAARVFDLENQVPESRSTLTFDYDSGNALSGYLRLNNYGSWKSTGGLFNESDPPDVSSYGSELLVDIEATYRFNDYIRLSVGSENVFDVEPDLEGDGTLAFLGARTAITSPFGNNGGFWYARLAVDF